MDFKVAERNQCEPAALSEDSYNPEGPFLSGLPGPHVHVEWNVSGSTSLALSQSKQEIGHLCPIDNAYDSLSSVTGAE